MAIYFYDGTTLSNTHNSLFISENNFVWTSAVFQTVYVSGVTGILTNPVIHIYTDLSSYKRIYIKNIIYRNTVSIQNNTNAASLQINNIFSIPHSFLNFALGWHDVFIPTPASMDDMNFKLYTNPRFTNSNYGFSETPQCEIPLNIHSNAITPNRLLSLIIGSFFYVDPAYDFTNIYNTLLNYTGLNYIENIYTMLEIVIQGEIY